VKKEYCVRGQELRIDKELNFYQIKNWYQRFETASCYTCNYV